MRNPGVPRGFLFLKNVAGKFDLIGIEFHPCVIGVQQGDLFDAGLFVIDEYLEVEIPHQIKVHFVPVVSDRHNIGSLLIQHAYSVVQ